MNIIAEYEQILIGNKVQFSSKNFQFGVGGNERAALSVFRYAIEKLLKWNPQEAYRLFNYQICEKMKLTPLLKYIRFPEELTANNTEYIITLLYPKQIKYDFSKYVIQVYKEVAAGQRKYPKTYMFGNKGLIRATVCLRYVLSRQKIFNNTEEMYKYFSSQTGMKFLIDNKLYQLYNCFYCTPLEYLHNSLPEDHQNELLFNFYAFCYRFRIQYHEDLLERNSNS